MQYILFVAIAADIYAFDYTTFKKVAYQKGYLYLIELNLHFDYKHIAIKPILVNTLRITRNI